ncbi:hypothetical protein ACFFKU_11960 [Kineococcus gynurae]|uniref:GAF domain-containing protein n=1 Tax=Kineococcus gynurae TaxID=452979 RepID=A0ABV5LR13_9ACTN
MAALGTRIGLAVLAAVVAILLGLEGADLWSPRPTPLTVLIVLAAVLAAVSTTWAAVDSFRQRRKGAEKEVLDGILTAAVWAVVDATGLDARELALAAYALRHRPGRGARLERLHRVRAARRPGTSQVVWTPGKGVIGRAVERGEVVAVDLSDPAAGPVVDPAGWGLAPTEAERLAGRYAVVVALPLVDDSGPSSRVVGCLALDGPRGSLPVLDTPRVRGVLEAAARAVRLGPPALAATVRSAAAPEDARAGADGFTASARRLGLGAERPR